MDSFKSRLFDTLKRLLTSAKVITLIVGVAVTWAAKRGIVLDPDMVKEIVALFASLIIAQGATDLGKGKAQIEAANPKPPEQVNLQTVNVDPDKTPRQP